MTETTTIQPPTPVINDNRPQPNQNEALKRFTEFTLHVLLLSFLLIAMLITGQLLTHLQRKALIENHNYIPNEKQETFKIKDTKEFYRKELENIQNGGFYGGNECYRLFVSEEGEIFCNNSLTPPIGHFVPPSSSPSGTIDINTNNTIDIKDIDTKEYIEYLNDLITKKKPFVVEFRKQTNSLLFYPNRETLFVDRIFQLKSEEFIGEILRNYFSTSFKNFLYDLKEKIKSPKENKENKKRLEVFKYFLFLGALNDFNVILCENYISVFGGRFQILLIGDFKSFLIDLFKIQNSEKLFLSGAFVDGIDFFKITGENAGPLKYGLKRKENETLKIKFLTFFGYGPLKEAQRVFQDLRNKVVKSYEEEWKGILKGGFEEKKLVNAFYGIETGWEIFDRVSLSDEMRSYIPLIYLRD